MENKYLFVDESANVFFANEINLERFKAFQEGVIMSIVDLKQQKQLDIDTTKMEDPLWIDIEDYSTQEEIDEEEIVDEEDTPNSNHEGAESHEEL